MNFKIISFSNKNLDFDDTVPSFRIPIDIEELIQREKEDLVDEKESRRITFFEMIPQEYIEHIEDVARKAFCEDDKREREYRDFREIIAENWLLKRAVFNKVSVQLGFSQVAFVDQYANVVLLILTISGSFVILSQPREGWIRDIYYIRIKGREKADVSSHMESCLLGDISIGSKLNAFNFNTSNIMYISFIDSADKDWLKGIADTLIEGFREIDEYTNTRIVSRD